MTLEGTINRNRYIGNGTARQFPFTFKAWKKIQVQTLVGDGTTETDVSASCAVELTASGGTVTFPAAPEPGTVVVIRRSMPFKQEDDYRNGTRFDAEEIEDRLDMDCAERQDLLASIERCAKVPETSSLSGDQLVGEMLQARQAVLSALAQAGDVTGATLVTAPGTTEPRAIQDRFADVKNVKDFGAVGNGLHDDTAAINAALSGGGGVYVPAGMYLVTDSLSIPSNTYLHGDGMRNTTFVFRSANPQARGMANKHSLLRDATATSGSDSSHWEENAVYDTNIYLANFTLDMAWHSRFEYTAANVGIGGPSGIELGGVAYATLKRVEVRNAGTSAFNTKAFYKANNLTVFSSYSDVQGRSHHILIEDCLATGCWRDDGFTTHMSDDVTIRNCHGIFTPLDSTPQHSAHHSSHAVEVDCGSRRVAVDCCTSQGISSCCGIVAHADELPCEDVHVSNCVCDSGDDPFSAWKDTDSGEQKQNRNITFTNCIVNGLASYMANDDSGLRTSAVFFNVLRAKNVKLENYKVFRGASGSSTLVDTRLILNRCTNCVVDGLSFVDVVMPEDQTQGKIGLISSSAAFSNVHSNCESYGSVLIDSYESNIGSIDTVFTDGSTERLYLLRTTSPTNRWGTIDAKNIDCEYQVKIFDSSQNEHVFRRPAYEDLRIGDSSFVGGLSFIDVEINGVQLCLHYSNPPYPQIGIDNIGDSNNIYFGGFDRAANDGEGQWLISNWLVPSTGRFNPESDGEAPLGYSGHKWSEVYASTGTISTSDSRLKTEIEIPGEAVFRAWGRVRAKLFKFRDAVEKKGVSARVHAGFIAQDIEAAFEAEGLDARNYGLFCYDEWEEESVDVEVVDSPAVYNEDGTLLAEAVKHTEKRTLTKAGSQYSLRYDEALALECAYQRWRLERLEERVNQLTNNSNS